MDAVTIIAFVLGLAVVGVIAYIKNNNLIKADKVASHIAGVLQVVLAKYAKEIKAYDKENNTKYYDKLKEMLDQVNALLADDQVTPMEFAVAVAGMYESLSYILETVNLFDQFADKLE